MKGHRGHFTSRCSKFYDAEHAFVHVTKINLSYIWRESYTFAFEMERFLNISVGWGTEIRLHTHLSMSCFYWKTVTGVGELGTSVASATAHTRQHPQHSHRLYSASNQHIHQYIMYCIIKSSGSHFGAVTTWSKRSVFWGMYRPKKKVGLVACGRWRIMIYCVSSTLKHEKVSRPSPFETKCLGCKMTVKLMRLK